MTRQRLPDPTGKARAAYVRAQRGGRDPLKPRRCDHRYVTPFVRFGENGQEAERGVRCTNPKCGALITDSPVKLGPVLVGSVLGVKPGGDA